MRHICDDDDDEMKTRPGKYRASSRASSRVKSGRKKVSSPYPSALGLMLASFGGWDERLIWDVGDCAR